MVSLIILVIELKKILGVSLIFFPLVSWMIMATLGVEFVWKYSYDYVLINTIYSTLCFFIFLLGLYLSSNRITGYIFFPIIFIFMCYQIFSWGFKGINFVDKLYIDESSMIVLSPNMGGALGKDFLNVVLVKKNGLIFIKSKVLQSFESASSGKIMNYDQKENLLEVIYLDQRENLEIKSVVNVLYEL